MADNWPLLVYIVATVALVALVLGVSHLLGERRPHPATVDPFESGIAPVGDARIRFSAKFYLVAVMFVIFDLEVAYIFGWAIGFRATGWTGFVEAAIFIGVLLAALVYLVRVGALDWAPQHRGPKR